MGGSECDAIGSILLNAGTGLLIFILGIVSVFRSVRVPFESPYPGIATVAILNISLFSVLCVAIDEWSGPHLATAAGLVVSTIGIRAILQVPNLETTSQPEPAMSAVPGPAFFYGLVGGGLLFSGGILVYFGLLFIVAD